MARLDRLGAAKEVAQIGAVIGREFSHALLASVARKPEAELGSALDRLIQAVCCFAKACRRMRAICSSMRWCRTPPMARCCASRVARFTPVSPNPGDQFADIAESQPELLARHFTEAGLIEKAAGLWGKAGRRSLDRSALIEAAAQLTRALEQIATLPAKPALRREQIKLQVALVNPLILVKGYGAPETKVAAERARLLIEEPKRSASLPKTRCCCFLSSTAFGSRVSSRSTAK